MGDFASSLAGTVVFLFDGDGNRPLGTGFVIGFPVPGRDSDIVPLVVTAKHVIGDRARIAVRFSSKDAKRPLTVAYDLAALRAGGDLWEHPNEGVDIVAFRTLHYTEVDYKPFPLGLVASREQTEQAKIIPTDRIVFPSLLCNFMGTSRNYPVMRDGSIAMMPEEPVPLVLAVGQRRIETLQPVMLVDALSIRGASGSPVFLWPGPRLRGDAFEIGGSTPWLLGIMHGFYLAQARETVPIATAVQGFAENSGIAIVFPSWRLLEVLGRPEVAARIAALAEQESVPPPATGA